MRSFLPTTKLILAPLLVATMIIGCDEEPLSALDIELVPDPALNTTGMVLERIDSVRIVVDSPEGLYEPGRERQSGTTRILNLDMDSSLELEAIFSVSGPELPVIRLERGGLPLASLDIVANGTSEDPPPPSLIAAGTAPGQSFERGAVRRVQVSFNILPEHLPPRVTRLYPTAEEELLDCHFASLIVEFSKAVTASSLQGNVLVEVRLDEEPAMDVPVTDIHLEGPDGIAGRFAEVALSPPQIPGHAMSLFYQVSISSNVVDEQGWSLDQVPSQEGNQAYYGGFTLSCYTGPSAPSIMPCGRGGSYCPGVGFFQCVDGSCLPTRCGGECPADHVCDPATFTCELRCSLYEDLPACPEARPVCESATGLCLSAQ